MQNGQQHRARTSEEVAAWDAEIEADFRRVVAGHRAAGHKKRRQRMVAFPLAFLIDVSRRTKNGATLIVAMLIYRRTHVCKCRTVTLPGAELTEVGVDKDHKFRALAKLEAAGLIRVERAVGRTSRVTLLWSG